jgi:hypothetical protein
MCHRLLRFAYCSISLLWMALAFPAGARADTVISGRVVDVNDTPVAGARVSLSLEGSGSWQAETSPEGAFRISLPALQPGEYLITVERSGYYAMHERAAHLDPAAPLTLVINPVREVFQSVDVHEQPSPVETAALQNNERLTGTEVNDIPYADSHNLVNALRLMPGVVSDNYGRPHFNGSSDGQIEYLLNGFDITDPITGQYQAVVAVEGVRSVDLSSGRLSPENGRGSAGALAITSESGTDTFRYTATDFIPGLNFQHGARLGNWFPRFGIYGPIARGRVWFADTLHLEYDEALINGLPSGRNTSTGWLASDLLHVQANVAHGNILFADFLVNIGQQNRYGLGVLDPVSTTTTLRTHRYFGSLRDQFYLGHATLIEFGYGHYQAPSTQTPQGDALYVFSPTGRSGNYFVNSTQTGSRDEGTTHAYLPQFQFAGSHQIEAGGGAERTADNADFSRTGYEVLGLAGDVLSATQYEGSGKYHVSDTELAWWLLDRWRLHKRLQVEAAILEQHDRAISANGWSPRAAFSWAPFTNERTVVSGGYSLTHDAVTLNLLSLPLDQTPVTTTYNLAGTPISTASATFAIPQGLQLPRASNWSLNVRHQLSERLSLTLKTLRRRGTDGFAYVNQDAPDAAPSLLPLPGAGSPGDYSLTNLRRDDFDSVQVSVRQAIAAQYEWMVSYTYTRALSNALLDFNSAIPLQVVSSMEPIPWDVPNRVLGFAYLPLPWKNWAIAALADARSGFPFSVADQYGVIAGAVDSHRYPFNCDLNLSIERTFTLKGYRFALRGGVVNLTNNTNPTAVINTLGAPNYLNFYGSEGRHFVVRVRFFGRAAAAAKP